MRWFVAIVVCGVMGLVLSSASGAQAGDFREAKTVFQTNTGYDPRLAIAADGVIVHRHGGGFARELQSWRDKGFCIGRMLSADSDAANVYWTGKWDDTAQLTFPNDPEGLTIQIELER